jgi:hypothetical protein
VRLIDDLEAAKCRVGRGQSAPSGLIRVTVAPVFGRLYIVPRLQEFFTRYPDIVVETVVTDRVVNLVEEGVDLALHDTPRGERRARGASAASPATSNSSPKAASGPTMRGRFVPPSWPISGWDTRPDGLSSARSPPKPCAWSCATIRRNRLRSAPCGPPAGGCRRSCGCLSISWHRSSRKNPCSRVAGSPTCDEECQLLLRRLADLDLHVQVVVEGPRCPAVLPKLEASGVKIVIDHFGHPDPAEGVNCAGFQTILRSVERGGPRVARLLPRHAR